MITIIRAAITRPIHHAVASPGASGWTSDVQRFAYKYFHCLKTIKLSDVDEEERRNVTREHANENNNNEPSSKEYLERANT